MGFMHWGRAGRWLTRYWVGIAYPVALIIVGTVYSALPAHGRTILVAWASTSVHNLEHDPVGCLVTSAFVSGGFGLGWPVLAALGLLGASQVLGGWRTVLVTGAGQVIGTLVSEGIVAYRVAQGTLPAADRYLTDVGPSYVVAAAFVVALLYGHWPARASAVLGLTLLITVADIFGGLSTLQVSAVGHLTSMVAGGLTGGFFAWRGRRKQGENVPGVAVAAGNG